MTQASATGFEPGTVQLRIQRATTAPPRYYGKHKNIFGWLWNDAMKNNNNGMALPKSPNGRPEEIQQNGRGRRTD